MNYYQITVPIPDTEEGTEILIALLSVIGFDSFEEKSEQLIAYIPEGDFNKKELAKIEYIQKVDESDQLVVELMPDKNWNEVWESNYPSVIIADRCYVRAPFHPTDPNIDYEILIKPKMAFGTAHHETTAMMLELILDNDFEDKKVLDMGCGSGVLAILASMKGARSINAIDIDKWSYENTTENAEVNEITNIKVFEGGAELLSDSDDYEIILANINKNILLRDMKYYSDALLKNGYIYFSGFYADDLADIISEASKVGLKYINNLEKNNWVATRFIKNR